MRWILRFDADKSGWHHPMMCNPRLVHVAILTLDGFNEIDSFVAQHILNRVQRDDWKVSLACPTDTVTSMNGVVVHAQSSVRDLHRADAVIVGSGTHTRKYADDVAFLASLRLDPSKQLIGSQCSGALLLAKLGLLDGMPACTDSTTKPWVVTAGVKVLEQPFSRVESWLPQADVCPVNTRPLGSSPGW
jgi:transcriptional regulator GlxA family with amidase domain